MGGNIVKGTHKIGLFVILNSLSLTVLLALYYGGANSLITGTYTIAMFVITSTALVKIVTKPSES